MAKKMRLTKATPIHKAYMAGYTIMEIATKHHTSMTLIARELRRRGIKVSVERANRSRRIKINVNKLKHDYAQGYTLTELAAKYCVNYGTIRQRLIDSGMKLRTRGPRRRVFP